jgi:hypothetical protein
VVLGISRQTARALRPKREFQDCLVAEICYRLRRTAELPNAAPRKKRELYQRAHAFLLARGRGNLQRIAVLQMRRTIGKFA